MILGMSGEAKRGDARALAFVRWAIRYGPILWALALVVAVPAASRTARLYLHLKSDLEALLPSKAPSVLALDEFRARMPVTRYLGIIVDVGTAENLPAGEAFLDALGERIKNYPPDLVAKVRTGVVEERDFLKKHAALYVDLPDLIELRRRIEARRDYEVTKQMGLDLSEENEELPPSLDVSDLEQKYKSRIDATRRFPNNRFSSAEEKLTLLLVEVPGFATGTDLGEKLFKRVSADIAALGGTSHFAPNMRIGYTGDVAITVEELAALVSDLTTSSVLVVVLVLSAIWGYYRWWPSIPILLLPLALSTVCTFALVTLPPIGITALNSNTAFLGSVIVGNGVNFGIILLARYREERGRGASVERALATAVNGTRVGTAVAAAAAAISYGSLLLTQFQGFRQFGTVGGIGMFASWAAAFLLAPSLISWFDTGEPTWAMPRAQHTGRRIMGALASLVARHPRILLGVAAGLTIVSLTKIAQFDKSYIESDFSRLRRRDTMTDGEGYWGRRMDTLLGRYLTPLVVMTDRPEETRELADRLKQRAAEAPLSGLVETVESIDDLVPDDQPEKIVQIRGIEEALTPRIRASLTEEQRQRVDELFASTELVPITEHDLPDSMTVGLKENDGRYDRAVRVYPRPTHATWLGEPIAELTQGLRNASAQVGAAHNLPPARVAGSIPLSYDIVQSILTDGPISTAGALGGVMMLVVAIFRFGMESAMIIGSLLMAVSWLAATAMALGIKINFSDFVAYPITFGIGVDYAVNMMARYRQESAASVERAMAATGGAVALASCTTIIGYSSLLFARNRGLFSFGTVAVMGEICCLSSALLFLPALITARTRWRQSPRNPGPRPRRSRYIGPYPADRSASESAAGDRG
jgi:predicted RND superfamily exporter protein